MKQALEFLIIYNPTAGRHRAARTAMSLNEAIRDAGHASRLVSTSAPSDAERIATDALGSAKGSLCVVACGGDGTVQSVVNALARVGPDKGVLGIAPAGRCNDFAHSLGIPADPAAIARILIGGRTRKVDLLRAGQRYFCTIAAIGFDAAVSRYVNEMRMPLRGTPAYLYGTLRMLLRYRTPTLRLRGDFGEYAGPVFCAASANTPCYGGAMRIAPHADLFDGKMDICLVTRIGRLRTLRLLPKVIAGDHLGLPEVHMLRTGRLSVDGLEDAADIEVWADGEPIGTLPITIEAVPAAVRIMLPACSD